MKKLIAMILAFCCILSLAGCKTVTTPEIEVKSFSYAEYVETYQEMSDPFVIRDGFQNTSVSPIHNAQDAISRAQNECNVEFDTIDVYYDDTTDMWMVMFHMDGYKGGGQCVCLDNDGITHLIFYGE